MNLILAILAFNLIIIIHELGHFTVAKLLGIKVYEFSLFMGPKIFSFQHKETIFSIRLIPIIAYVSFDKEDSVYEDRALNKYPVAARALVIAAGPLFNIIGAAIALAIMFSISGYNTTAISDVQSDTPAYEAGVKPGDTIISFDNRKIYQPREIDIFVSGISKEKTVDVEVLRDGNIVPIKLTPTKIPENRSVIGFSPKDQNGAASNIIGSIEKGSPAQQSGLKVGDQIVKLNNKDISNMQQILNFMYQNKGEPIKVTVIRNGERLKPMEVTPKHSKNPELFITGLNFAYEKGNILGVAKQAILNTYSYTRIGVYSIGWLVQGKVPFNQMTGAVGAVDAINTVVEQSTTAKDVALTLLFMSAFISIALGITNLLPIPPADGSKLLLLAVEAIRRKPLSQNKEAAIMMAGFVFMVALFIFTLYNDIARIITRAFGG